MKLRTVLPMLAVATFALAACAPKVDYAKFHEKAVAAAKEDPGYKKVTIKGSLKSSAGGMNIDVKFDHVYEKDGHSWKLSKGEEGLIVEAAALTFVSLRAEDVPEDKDYEYYAGGSFKVVMKDGDDKATVTFDKYGYVTSEKGKADSGEVDIKVSWSKQLTKTKNN